MRLSAAVLCLVVLSSLGGLTLSQDETSTSPAELALGEKLYNTHCRACHLPGGRSRIKKLNLSDTEWSHGDGQLADIKKAVSEGIEATQMQSFKHRLKPEEITAVAKYVLTFSQTSQAGR